MKSIVTASSLDLSRRELGGLSIGAMALLAGVRSAPSLAQGKPPEEGIDYNQLAKPAPTEGVKGKIEVVEFFWYHCPHCHHFEPALQVWLKKLPKDVHFRRVHVAFRPDFVLDQKLFYTLEAMGKVEQLHSKVFAAIHTEKLDLSSREKIIDWATKQGLDKAKFTKIYDSFAIGSKATRATQLQDAYNVTGVPALGIAGQFYTDGAMAQSMARALQITDYLIAVQRKKR
ncbi:MAG: thiol:disulfide interchange protein DsbA/DsbL [Cytophagales bacterium]|nr:thiol:disulfide interchange protein DsbA/DsbL [Cytophagales bacterium]